MIQRVDDALSIAAGATQPHYRELDVHHQSPSRDLDSDTATQLLVEGARSQPGSMAGVGNVYAAVDADYARGHTTYDGYARPCTAIRYRGAREAGRHRHAIRFELKERTSAEIVRMILAGMAEAGVASSAVGRDTGLMLEAVATNHLVLIVPASSALACTRSVRFADIVGQSFVGLEAGSALQDHIDGHAENAGRALAFRIRMKTFEGLCEMVSHGIGVGIVPRGDREALSPSLPVPGGRP